MRKFLPGFALGILVAALGGLAYLRLGLADTRADLSPSNWETNLLYSAIHASVRRSAPKLQNPVPATDENLIAGGKKYLDGCAGCHGEPGKPPSDFGATFYPRVPQFPQVGTAYSEPEMFWIVKHGIRRTGMSAYGPFFKDEEIWTLVEFIKRMNSLPASIREALKPKKPGQGQ